MEKSIRFVLSVIAILAIVGCFVFIARYTNNFTGNFSTFYLESNGKMITCDTSKYSMEIDKEYRFEVGYTFNFLNKDEQLGYHVSIVPNITNNTDFDFTVDNLTKSYNEEKDLTKFFNIKTYDKYFTIKPIIDLPEMMTILYSGKTVLGVPITKNTGKDYFIMVVSSADKTTVINVAFNLRSK